VQKVGFVKYKSGLLHGHKMKIGKHRISVRVRICMW